MTSAWQYPVQSHPWFRMPSLKRKAVERESSSSSADSDLERFALPRKRFKCGILESGFAQLSLNQTINAPLASTPSLSTHLPNTTHAQNDSWASQSTSTSASGDATWGDISYADFETDPQHASSIVLPGSVEEPSSPEAQTVQEPQDVTMKSRSWYEPEKDRIVIVDLDDSDLEDSADDSPELTVNSALLSRIRDQRANALTSRKDAGPSMALVLYKPLPVLDGRGDTGVLDSCLVTETHLSSRTTPASTSPEDLDIDLDTGEIDSLPMDVDDAMEVE
ncbi:hypothetical protein BC835DRAFT_1309554 [Cytidiella melzeri]|nr:hypothetical protein BC835DRAFT_1309554 [Cytidiella melzeri]